KRPESNQHARANSATESTIKSHTGRPRLSGDEALARESVYNFAASASSRITAIAHRIAVYNVNCAKTTFPSHCLQQNDTSIVTHARSEPVRHQIQSLPGEAWKRGLARF